jgi:hypothetical protein
LARVWSGSAAWYGVVGATIEKERDNASNTQGDSRHETIKFDAPMPGPAPGKRKGAEQVISVIVTAVQAGTAVVPCATKVNSAGFTFFGRNADPRKDGDVAFNYLAVLAGIHTRTERQLEARLQILQPKLFDQYLDQHMWPRIWYSEPYATRTPKTPRVFLTANNLNVESQNPATAGWVDHPFLVPPVVLASGREENPVIPMIRDVTSHGFTAGVRNTDSVGRHALFDWVALGCSDGCG